MTSRALKNTLRPEVLFWTLSGVVFMLVLMYGYFVQQTIFNVAGRAQAEKSIAQIHSRLGELESDYLALKREVTIDKAYALGFKEVEETVFVAKNGSRNLSYNQVR